MLRTLTSNEAWIGAVCGLLVLIPKRVLHFLDYRDTCKKVHKYFLQVKSTKVQKVYVKSTQNLTISNKEPQPIDLDLTVPYSPNILDRVRRALTAELGLASVPSP